jgi:hypothetical protein
MEIQNDKKCENFQYSGDLLNGTPNIPMKTEDLQDLSVA